MQLWQRKPRSIVGTEVSSPTPFGGAYTPTRNEIHPLQIGLLIENACRDVYSGDEQAMKEDFAKQMGIQDDLELAVNTTIRFGTEIR